MPAVIDEICIGCGKCYYECPVRAIVPSGEAYVVNQDECIECGQCLGLCPTRDAIHME